MSKSNLCIVGLPKQFIDILGKELSSKMDMFYANIEEIFAYELIDMARIEELCGLEYLQKEERSIVKRICGYDNTLINIDYAVLNKGDILELIKQHCLLLYFDISRNRYQRELDNEGQSSNLKLINMDVFQDRSNLCKEMADIVVDCEELDLHSLVDKTIEIVMQYFA